MSDNDKAKATEVYLSRTRPAYKEMEERRELLSAEYRATHPWVCGGRGPRPSAREEWAYVFAVARAEREFTEVVYAAEREYYIALGVPDPPLRLNHRDRTTSAREVERGLWPELFS